MMNAPKKNREAICSLLPGMTSPTVVPLADPDLVAIHAAIPEESFWEVIEKLKQKAATDILVVPVEKLVS